MKTIKFAAASLFAALIVCALIAAGMIIYQSVTDILQNDSAQALARRAKYNNLVRLRGLQQTGPESSAGYKSIEMLALYFGMEETPAPGKNKNRWNNIEFLRELQNVFPERTVTKHSNLKNSELIDLIYDSLESNNPVIIFHADKKPETPESAEKKFEMRYSVVVGVDLPNNRITLSDPYGTVLRYTLDDFIRSARFDNYETTLYEKLTFALRIYAKNTIYIITPGSPGEN